jgi:hypothetical protein
MNLPIAKLSLRRNNFTYILNSNNARKSEHDMKNKKETIEKISCIKYIKSEEVI